MCETRPRQRAGVTRCVTGDCGQVYEDVTLYAEQKLNRADMEIQATRDAIEAAPNDAEQERKKIVNSILRNQEDMRIRRKMINDLRVLAGLPANEEFLDAENAEV